MFGRLRNYFLSGLVVFMPLALTIYLLFLTIGFVDGLLHVEDFFQDKFGFYLPGTGIIICILLLVGIGFFATNFFGKKLHQFFEGLLLKLPFFKQVYPAIKEISLFLFSRERLKFQQAVLIEYPRKGVYSIGFLTNEEAAKDISDKVKTEICNVFVPSAPGPLTGFVIMVPKKDIIHLDLSAEQVIKLIVSGGVVTPETSSSLKSSS